MSCTTCFQTPCCCPGINCCTETVEYQAVNINLTGVGVFDNLNVTEFQFRGIVGLDPISATLNNVTSAIEISFDDSSFLQQAVATDSAARNSATPVFLGQLLLQIDTGVLYYGSSLVAGGWTLVVV